MRVTDAAERPPHACAVTNREKGPFVDFQSVIEAPSPAPQALYVHTLIVEEAGKLLGMVPGKEVDELRTRLAEAEAELADLREVRDLAGKLERPLRRLKERKT